ncbi:hypothetical protein Pan258_29350 [Symmachiella dynata]|nr:hypothetical protein Pan258_29350 [Symmachiella dynata]
MSTQRYNSACESKTSKKRKKKRNDPSQLAQDSFDAFEPFVNVFDCGGIWNGPYHLITKEDWEFHRRYKAVERNLRYPDGTKFNPYLHVVSNIISPKHVHKHMEDCDTSYYTSGKKGLGLLYLDIDAHHEWQTDEHWAKHVLKKLFPFGYYRASGRGQNGYLKVRYTSIEEFNRIAKSLEQQLKRLFLHLGILCDIEVKGTITHKGTSGSLAKLPFNQCYPCHMRDETDYWNYPQLRLFKACPIVNVRRIRNIVGRLQPQLDDQKIQQFQELKTELASKLEKSEDISVPVPTKPQSPPLADVGGLATPNKVMVAKATTTLNLKPPTGGKGVADEGNAFSRNQKVLLPFVREFYKKHRQFPDATDALTYLRDNRLFSGQWEDREHRRVNRVEQILAYTEQTFDPEALGSENSPSLSLSLGRHAWWVRQQFGAGIKAKVVKVRSFDPVSMTAPVSHVFVPDHFIETFMEVADVCLNSDPLENKAVPTNRIKKLWAMVEGGAAWNQKYFQIVRDRLDRMGVIRITDRHHQEGKAWRWVAGSEFPSDSWKEHQQRYRVKILKGEAQELCLVKNKLENNKVHNTLYQIQSDFQSVSPLEPAVRPPPI